MYPRNYPRGVYLLYKPLNIISRIFLYKFFDKDYVSKSSYIHWRNGDFILSVVSRFLLIYILKKLLIFHTIIYPFIKFKFNNVGIIICSIFSIGIFCKPILCFFTIFFHKYIDEIIITQLRISK